MIQNHATLSGMKMEQHRASPEEFSARNSRGDLRNLNLSDNYLFEKVMQDPELCRRVLEEILQVSIQKVETIHTEHSEQIRPDSKGIRMDVYVNDAAGTVYNVEMQTGHNSNLPKRARYYQDIIDLELLAGGQDYIQLNRSYVIFICTFGLFSHDRHIYTFVNTCRESPSLELGDETTKIFLSTRGILKDGSDDLLAFLNYVENSTDEFAENTDSELVRAIHRKVQEVKDTRKYQVEYMTLYMHEQDIAREARSEGRAAAKEEAISQVADYLQNTDPQMNREEAVSKAAEILSSPVTQS